jgi:parallel beta-helix repeat protein
MNCFCRPRGVWRLPSLGTHRLRAYTCFALLIFAGTNTVGHAQKTIHVPVDSPSIQAGIIAASNGDTVLVAPGTYTENINFIGKSITVASSGGAASTTINGNNNGVVVTFASGETRNAILNGFTIQNGGLPANPSVTATSDGILVQSADPTIVNNTITNNRGYGIEISFGAALVQGNTISNTTTRYDPTQDFGCDYDDGSGISSQGGFSDYSIIEDNIIEHNTARCGGGGILLYAAPVPHILNNRILYNQTLGGRGGGIYMVNGTQVWIVQNLIVGNTAAASGGGVYEGATSETDGNSGPVNSYLVNNTIVGNTISPNPGLIDDYEDGSQVGFGGYTSQTGLYNNIIISGDSYNAIACDPTYSYLSKTPPVIDSSDVFSYTGNEFGGWCTAQAGTSAGVYKYISADPMFVSKAGESFHLGSGSPAAAVGDPAAPYLPATDLDGAARTQSGSSGASVVDLGVYEGAVTGTTASGTPGYAMHLSSTSVVLTNSASYGYSATATVQITPQNGFLGTVSLQCTGLPTSISAQCYFSPNNLAAAGDNAPLTATLRIEDRSATAEMRQAEKPRTRLTGNGWIVSAASLLLCPLGMVWIGRKRHSLLQKLSMFSTSMLLLIGATVSLTGCGGGGTTSGGGTTGGGGNPGTPEYTVTVVATSTGNAQVTQSTIVTFSVPN